MRVNQVHELQHVSVLAYAACRYKHTHWIKDLHYEYTCTQVYH